MASWWSLANESCNRVQTFCSHNFWLDETTIPLTFILVYHTFDVFLHQNSEVTVKLKSEIFSYCGVHPSVTDYQKKKKSILEIGSMQNQGFGI